MGPEAPGAAGRLQKWEGTGESMPEKNVNDAEKHERMEHPLSFKLFRFTFLTWMIAGILAMAVGLMLYGSALLRKNVDLAYNVAKGAALTVTHSAHRNRAVGMMNAVWNRYSGLSEEELAEMGTAAYDARFLDLQDSREHRELRDLLRYMCDSYAVYDIYIALIDGERNRFVYVADPDEEELMAGWWEELDAGAAERFLNWNGDGKRYLITISREWGWLCTAGTPIYSETGEEAGYILVDLSLDSVLAEMRNFVIVFSLSVLAINLIATWFAIRRQNRQVVEPIGAITEAAKAYGEDHKAGALTRPHFSALELHTGDELENLSQVMKGMEKDIAEYTANLAAVTAEKERVATELSMAASIQAAMLPNTFPAFPDRPEFDIYATMDPAKEVGGDFYDFFLLDDKRLALMIADVSGKGVPAALFMMTARTMLRGVAQAGLDPAGVLSYVNAQICDNNPEDMFVTVWLGYLDLTTGLLTWADAGHEPLMLYKDGAWRKLSRKGGIALGFLAPEFIGDKSPYKNQELQLRPGDAVFQYTDGVTEAMTAKDEFFGEERLLSTLAAAPSPDPERLLPHVSARLEDFVKGAPQFDDITMLGLRYNGGTKE